MLPFRESHDCANSFEHVCPRVCFGTPSLMRVFCWLGHALCDASASHHARGVPCGSFAVARARSSSRCQGLRGFASLHMSCPKAFALRRLPEGFACCLRLAVMCQGSGVAIGPAVASDACLGLTPAPRPVECSACVLAFVRVCCAHYTVYTAGGLLCPGEQHLTCA